MENDEIEKAIQSKPNYFAVIPSEIRYNSNLTWMEKVLYAEIAALSNKEGYCFATNAYFAKSYNNSVRTISRAISNLNEKGYIMTLFEVTGAQTLRKIYLSAHAPQIVKDDHKRRGGTTNMSRGVDKDVYHNNISNNISNNTPLTEGEAKPEEKVTAVTLPPWMGRTAHERLGKLYELLWERNMGLKTKLNITGRTGALIKQLISSYTEITVALMLIVHFEWRGTSGGDNSAFTKLREQGFPLAWVPSKADTYRVFIINNMKLDTEEKQNRMVLQALVSLTTPRDE